PAAHSAAVAATRPRSCLCRRRCRAGVRAGGGGRGEEEKAAAEAGERRKETAVRRAEQLRRRPGFWECRRGEVVGADPAGPGRGKESPARPWRTTRNWTTNGSRISRTKAATWSIRTTGVNFSVEKKNTPGVRGHPGDANSALQRPVFYSGHS
ncbi:hypothetical protein MC885_015588, partial [Smutsia gigantea]